MRLRSGLLEKLSVILVCFGSLASVYAQSPGAKPSTVPHPVVPTSDTSKEALVFESNRLKIAYQDDGSDVRELTSVVRVLSQAGVQGLAVLTFPYTSANEAVEFDYVRVRKPDGTVVITPDYNVQDMPADVTRNAPMYSDVHEKHVTVKGLGVGDTLEYLVRYRTVKPQVPGQFWFSYNFPTDVVAKDQELEISVPQDKYVKVASPGLTPVTKDEGGRRTYIWKTANLERKEDDPLEPKRDLKPSVQITTFHTWEEVGHWYGELARSQLIVTSAIQTKAVELTKGLNGDQDKIRALYDFVSTHYHYVSLSFGIGRFQPHPAEDVLENEYGDCKDKHTLLAALLKAVGYDAWPALINALQKVDPNVPSPGQFNHVITVVPLNGNLLWMDTTPEIAPYGLLMANIRDKWALVMPTNKPAMLMTTPANPPFPTSITFAAESEISADGTLKAHIRETLRGDAEVMFRAGFRGTSSAQWKELGQRISYMQGFGGEVTQVTASAPDATDKPFDYSYDYTRKAYGDWDNHRIPGFTPLFGFEAYGDRDKAPQEAILLGGTGDVLYTSKLRFPAGYTVIPPPKLDLSEDFADYHSSYSFKDGVLSETRELKVKMAEVPPSSWDVFKKFCKEISDDRGKWITVGNGTESAEAPPPANPEADRLFQDGYDALQKRDVTRAEESFARVIEIDPKYPYAHSNLGTVYLDRGNLEAGMRELRKEEEFHPDEAYSYMMLARVMAFKHDNPGAIEQLQKLLKIDPKNRDAALTLGQLLTGEKKYSEAVTVLQNASELAPDSGAIQYQLGYAYIKAGDKDKGLGVLQKSLAADQNTDRGSSELNSVAYSLIDMDVGLDIAKGYADKALQQQNAASLKPGIGRDALFSTANLGATWDTVGWIKFKLGKYDEALPYLRASWLLTQNAEVGDHLGQLYAKLGKKQEAEQTYKLAYAALGQSGHGENSLALSGKIKDHYQDLLGKSANPGQFETKRKADGTFTPMPGEELSRMRMVKVPAAPHASGSATYSITFSPGKVDDVKLVDGDKALESMTVNIQSAKFKVEFPDETPAKLVRRGILSCGASGCDLTLIPPEDQTLLSAAE